MRMTLKGWLVAVLVMGGLSVGTDAGVAAPMPASIEYGGAGGLSEGKDRGDPWCLFCDKYEDTAWNWMTEDFELVIYAYCMQYFGSEMEGGAMTCNNPIHQFDLGGEWVGGECSNMNPYNDDFGWEECDCEFNSSNWPWDPRTVDGCFHESPASGITADGFSVAAILTGDVGDAEADRYTCSGMLVELGTTDTPLLSFGPQTLVI